MYDQKQIKSNLGTKCWEKQLCPFKQGRLAYVYRNCLKPQGHYRSVYFLRTMCSRLSWANKALLESNQTLSRGLIHRLLKAKPG
jgi:hypothetical protein